MVESTLSTQGPLSAWKLPLRFNAERQALARTCCEVMNRGRFEETWNALGLFFAIVKTPPRSVGEGEW